MEEKNADKQGVAVFTSLTNQTSATQLAMAIDNLPPFARVSARGGGGGGADFKLRLLCVRGVLLKSKRGKYSFQFISSVTHTKIKA